MEKIEGLRSTRVRIKLTFDDWIDPSEGRPTEKTMAASLGDFHGGSTFNATIFLDPDQEEDLRESLSKGLLPTFILRTTPQPEEPHD